MWRVSVELESVIRFTADNIGNILSTKRIADLMTADGRKIDQKAVEKYLSTLCESFFLYEVKRYNIKGKQLLKTLGKYYLVDIGLRRMLLGSRSFDAGRILENIVYLELLRRQKKVYIGKMDNLEVDFVAIDENDMRTRRQIMMALSVSMRWNGWWGKYKPMQPIW